MKTLYAIAVALAGIGQTTHAQLSLGPGDVSSWSYGQVPLVLTSSAVVPIGTPPTFGVSFELDLSSIQPGDSFRVDLMGNGIQSLVWDGLGSGQSLFMFGYPGVLQFTGISGSVTISRINFWQNQYLIVEGPFDPPKLGHYEASIVPVPEPGSLMLAAVGLAGVCLRARAHLRAASRR